MIVRPAEDSPIIGSIGARGRMLPSRRRPGPASRRQDRAAHLRPGRSAPWRGDACVRGQLCASSANVGFRGHRLRSRCCWLGSFLGYRVTVCDAPPVFATRTRFPDAHGVIVTGPTAT